MIPRIKNYRALDNYMLYVEFDDGYKVMYDIRTLPSFRPLLDICGLFKQVQVRFQSHMSFGGMKKLILLVIVSVRQRCRSVSVTKCRR